MWLTTVLRSGRGFDVNWDEHGLLRGMWPLATTAMYIPPRNILGRKPTDKNVKYLFPTCGEIDLKHPR